jgi:hypothetical protein
VTLQITAGLWSKPTQTEHSNSERKKTVMRKTHFGIFDVQLPTKLGICSFHPRLFGLPSMRFRLQKETRGTERADGISSFVRSLQCALRLSPKEGRAALFKHGVLASSESITGTARLNVFGAGNLAHPDLLWSLHEQKGQLILRFLHCVFGVKSIEALRQVFLAKDGSLHSLVLFMVEGGSWSYTNCPLVRDRNVNNPVLVLL